MKTKILLPLLASVMMASAAHAATADNTAGAKIVAPLRITAGVPLYFGTVAPSLTTADTVTVAANGTRTCGVNLSCLTADHTAASFDVTGATGFSYTISTPASITVSNANGQSMTIDNVSKSKASGTLVNGVDAFTVGGRLNVAALQEAGDYTGTFTATVEYQ